MKNIPLLLLILAVINVSAQSQQKTTIEHVTVFLRGAEIESKAKVTLPQGESEVVFTNIAGNINPQSIAVAADNGVIVQSATAQNNYLTVDAISPRSKIIKDSIEILEEQRQNISDKRDVVTEQLAILKENRKIAGTNTGLSTIELQKMLDLIGSKMNGLLTQSASFNKQIRKLDESIVSLQKQLAEEQKKGVQPGGQLVVKFYTTQPMASNIQISYVVPNAGWTPNYDLRVESINKPVQFLYKAKVFQNTGINWNGVKLTLSTGNPNEGAEAPVLSPWHLAFYTPPPVYRNDNEINAHAMGVNIKKSETSGSFNRVITDDFKYATPSTIDQYVQVDNSGINTNFDIDLAYTIPNDGKEHLVNIKNYELPATYRYYTVPKLDRDAFLQARVTNWENLNLLPGSTNIFFENTYVGQGHIDMRNVRDTMLFSLGRDKKIVVRREKDNEFRATKTFSNNVTKSYSYIITVRNTKPQPISLTVLDQFPVSNDKEITIEDKTAPQAEINETLGTVKWIVDMKPNDTQKRQLGFSVKHPKDKAIRNL